MSALEPGLYRATVRGVPDVIVMVDDVDYVATAESILGKGHYHNLSQVTDARPLAVLDLGSWFPVRFTDAEKAVRESSIRATTSSDVIRDILLQVIDQTRPARIPEPARIGAIVHASQVGECDGSERIWTRFNSQRTEAWIDTLGHIRNWDELENISETSAS